MDWLGAHAIPDAIVLSHAFDGNVIPARTGLRVYAGHGHQTVNWDEKLFLADWFFHANGQDTEKEQFLAANRITYVFYSSVEKNMGSFRPSQKPYLTAIYSSGGVTIFRVHATSAL